MNDLSQRVFCLSFPREGKGVIIPPYAVIRETWMMGDGSVWILIRVPLSHMDAAMLKVCEPDEEWSEDYGD